MKNLFALLALVLFGTWAPAHVSVEASTIIGVSSPIDSDDAQSHPRDDNVWSVNVPPFPFNINSGIGYLINPSHPTDPTPHVMEDFSRHDHAYSAAHVPDPTRAVVTYQFNTPTIVDQLEIIQHTNGITRIEGFVGNSVGSLSSIGAIFGPSGDNTIFTGLTEGYSEVFDFDNAISGTYFQFIVRKTNASDGWATYRAFPRLDNGTRFPAAGSMFAADFDMDGDVDGDDFIAWQIGFGTQSEAEKSDGDYDNDGDVDGDDFLGWQVEFPSPGSSGISSAAVPEPSSIAMVLVIAATGVFVQRGRTDRLSR